MERSWETRLCVNSGVYLWSTVFMLSFFAHMHVKTLFSHVNFYRDMNRHGHCHWLIYRISIMSFKVLYSVSYIFQLVFLYSYFITSAWNFWFFFLSLYMCVNILYANVEWTNVMNWLCSNVYFSIQQLSIHAAFFLISMHWPVCHCSAWQRVSKWNESTDSRHPVWVPRSSIFIRV